MQQAQLPESLLSNMSGDQTVKSILVEVHSKLVTARNTDGTKHIERHRCKELNV